MSTLIFSTASFSRGQELMNSTVKICHSDSYKWVSSKKVMENEGGNFSKS